ncbi:hypothetical protein AKO1_008088 [Acrasis kona]|uniref:RGS domain-containing protein n=1 Tax=Acrasis kona TaxID=1008807 RepID=A0AAW2YQY0_9EUKA
MRLSGADLMAYDYTRVGLYDVLTNNDQSYVKNLFQTLNSNSSFIKVHNLYGFMRSTRDTEFIQKTLDLSNYTDDSRVYEKLAADILEQIYQTYVSNTDDKKNLSTFTLSFVSVMLVVFVAVGIALTYAMSLAITGPWRRLNWLQENSIRKFVPQGFLNLIKCKKLSDVHLGMNNNCNITMLRLEISNYEEWTNNFSSTQGLNLLNKLFNQVCPQVRSCRGFVDRYNHDGFTAIFKKNRQAIQASQKINRMLNRIRNEDPDYQNMKTGIAIHASRVLVGTVGEEERMDGAILSDQTSLNHDLLRINDKLGASIVLSGNVSGTVNLRSLGSSSDRHKKTVDIYEMYDVEEQNKKKTSKLFNDATRAFSERRYYKASQALHVVLELDPSDQVCSNMLKLCNKIVDQCEAQISKMDPIDIVNNVRLRSLLEKQCTKEYSSENFELFKAVESYKKIDDISERKKAALRIYNDFCDINGSKAVNLQEKMCESIRDKLTDESNFTAKNLLDGLMKAALINMSDTVRRLMDAQEFKEACSQIFTEGVDPLL